MKSSLVRMLDAKKSLQSLGRGDKMTSSPLADKHFRHAFWKAEFERYRHHRPVIEVTDKLCSVFPGIDELNVQPGEVPSIACDQRQVML